MTRRRSTAGSVPLTARRRTWLTIWVLIWPALLIAAATWATGSTSTITNIAYVIAACWVFLRYRQVSKRIFTVTTKRRRRKARR